MSYQASPLLQHGRLVRGLPPLKPHRKNECMRNRNNRIVFYLTDNELLSLQNKIAKTGLSREAYIRKIIRDITPKELPNADFNSVLYQLRMIGNNIHQIAIKANTLQFIDAPEYRKNYEHLQTVIGEIMEVIN